MKRAIYVAAALALLAALLPASASAFKPPQVTMMKLAVEVTGIHVVDWHYQSTDVLDPEEPWQLGSGTQTLGFSSPKPAIYFATVIRGNVPGGNVEPFSLGQATTKPLEASLRRKGSWRYHAGNPCGGEGCPGVVPIAHPKPSCPARRATLPVTLEVTHPRGQGAKLLTAGFGLLNVRKPWTNCPPDVDGARDRLSLSQPRAVFLPTGIDRVSGLRRGATVTLKGSTDLGSGESGEARKCPAMSGKGMRQCAVTDVTVEVTRLR